jgi:hypothetical protein
MGKVLGGSGKPQLLWRAVLRCAQAPRVAIDAVGRLFLTVLDKEPEAVERALTPLD